MLLEMLETLFSSHFLIFLFHICQCCTWISLRQVKEVTSVEGVWTPDEKKKKNQEHSDTNPAGVI